MKSLLSGNVNILISVEFTRRSKNDLKKIFDYTAREFGLERAHAYRNALHEKIELLRHYPELGFVSRSVPVCRVLRCREHMVFYRSVESVIQVIRILHISMDKPRHLEHI